MPIELFVILVLVLANGLFAGAEIAIISVRSSLVRQGADRGLRAALAVQALRERPERFLATVQIGITVISTAAAAFGGARIATSLTPILEDLGIGARADELAFGLVIAFVSIMSLVLGELVPKSLALRYSSGYSFLVSRPLLALSRIAAPLVWFLTFCSNVVLRLFGDKTSFTETRMSRDELKQLVEEAAKTGSVDAQSSEIASRALELGEIAVAEVMIRRERIVSIPRDAGPAQVQRILLEEGHSRMPVHDGDLDNVIGYVVARDVLAMVWEQGLIVLDDIVRQVVRVPLTMRAGAVLRQLQAQQVQLAMVVDEHGGVAGLVTIEDLLEEIVGDIRSEGEVPDAVLRPEPDGTTLVPGWVPIRKLNRALHLDLPIGRDSTTVAGLCLALALAIPPVGTRLQTADGTTLEIVDSSERRVRMVRVHQRKPARAASPGDDRPA